jgi:all-trans-retinol 13,14-reductase
MTKAIASYKQTDIDENWDVIVIGSGPGGLGASSVLAKEGKRVLVLEQHYAAGGFSHVFKRKGYEWDVGLHYIGEVHQEHSMARKMFDYVSNGQIQWEYMGDVYDRIRFGDDEYALRAGNDNFRTCLMEWFPEEEQAIDAYIQLVIDTTRSFRSYMAEKATPKLISRFAGGRMRRAFEQVAGKTTLEVLQGLTQNKRMIGVLCGQYGDYGLPPGQSSFGMHAILVRHYFRGGSYPVGGASVIANTIAQVIHDNGGQVITKARVTRINVSHKKATGVTLADGRTLHAPIVISGAGYINTVQHLIDADIAADCNMLQPSKTVDRSAAHVCLYVGCEKTAEDLQMPRSNHWLYPTDDHDQNIARYLEDRSEPLPLTYISFPSAKDPDWTNRYPGKSTIQAITLAPYEWFAEWEGTRWMKRGDDYLAFKQEFTDRLLSELYRVEPQIEGHVDHCELSTPLSTAHFSGHRRGEIYGLAHSPDRFLARHLTPRTPIKGLWLTGQDISTAGIGGALVAGFLTASAIASRNLLGRI